MTDQEGLALIVILTPVMLWYGYGLGSLIADVAAWIKNRRRQA